MANIHLCGLDPLLIHELKQTAEEQHVSVNTLILTTLRQQFGLANNQKPLYHDLDKLAGTWTEQEARSFMKYIADFESIDKDLWK